MNVDQSAWGCVRVTGVDRIRFLQGMCTANVDTLAEGDWARASMLDAKGRVMSVFDVVKRADDLLLLTHPGLAEKTRQLLDKHAIMDQVEFAIVDQPVHRVWTSPADVWTAPPVLAPCPAPVASPEAVEARRIEAGMPLYGVDVGEKDFPFESRLREAIDYDKGCFLGQEPVSRVQHQGRPNKDLLGLRIEGDDAVAIGATVSHPDRPDAGTVRAAAVSPEFGAIALATLHRSVAEPGTRVEVAGRPATVSALPFDTGAQSS